MQHQAYQPLLPCANKYLQYKWDKSCYETHRNRVQTAKATINTTPPKVYSHLLVKGKKQKLEEDRLSTIQRENHMLLDKINHIMKTTGRTDCKNDYVQKSLISGKRQQDLLQIVKENQLMFQRLSQCRATYSAELWRNQWLENLNLMENIGRFPSTNSTQPSSSASSKKTSKTSKKSIQADSLSKDKKTGKHEEEEKDKPQSEHKSSESNE
ncbi:sperm axonemal maintenance protein CFAP97D1 [Astyanax mexicanus]|uniref:sperm axonemal maintenance protein CFAP97D1 n=1 Tax=Astyanax mexicanus TaxID=7994 RepID=UPI000BBD56E0|nr:sperm axonemal maintenance protein CFAP97D1 [Astyanax mexicanus]